MSKKEYNGLTVDGPIRGSVQASAAGDVPILNSDAELPGSIIPDITSEFTIPATAWTGTGPYTAEVTVADVAGIATPIIGPNAPDGSTREALADAQITALSVNASGKVTLVADGDKPSILLNCIATGIKGAQTGHVVSTFGAGGGGVDFFLNVTVTASAGAPDLSGINITATPTTGTAITATTNGEGKATLGVKQGMTYTVALSKTNFTITPASSVVTIQDTSTTLSATCYEAPKLTVTCTGADKAGRLVTCTPEGGTPKTGTTNASGQVTIVLEIDDYTVTVDHPTGQGVSPASASVSATAGGVYSESFTILDKPTVTITVDDKSSSGYHVGRTITATPSTGTAITGTTNASGVTNLTLMAGLAYVISCDYPVGYVQSANYPLTPVAGQAYTHTFDLYKEAQITVSVTPTAVRSGRTITATCTGIAPVTGKTSTAGSITLSVPAGTWTITCDTPAGYFAPASQSQTAVAGQTYTKTFALDKMPVLTVTVTPMAAASGLLVRAVGDTTVTAYTNSSGVATLELVEDEYLVSVVAPAGYFTPASQSLTAVRNVDSSKSFALQTKPTVAVTVVDSSSSGYQVGRTITATNGTDTVTGTTNASGVVNLTLNGTGAYTISTNLPSGATADPVSITAAAGGSYTATLTLNFGFKFSMTLNATTMQTDPTGCLAYGDDASGMTPLANTNTSLAAVPVSARGSWIKDTNKLLKKLYYATFNTDGTISKILNPDNLALDMDGNASDITTKNTMLVIPTLYTKGENGKITISDKPAEGTAHAHTIGGHVYDYLAIGVYNGSVSNGKLMSLSGVLPTKNQTRATFRTQANATGTNWMLWNYWHWKLLKEMTFFTLKSFDGQRKLGQGGHAYGSNTTGLTNGMGMFAGDISGTTSAMKCFIEDWWGSEYQFIDDFYGNGGTYYAGKNAIPTDDTANKVSVFNNLTGGWWYGNTINQTDVGWAIASAAGGDNAKGLCDGQYGATSSDRLGYVGGSSGSASDGGAGPSCLYANAGLSGSSANFGARLAFVFDD